MTKAYGEDLALIHDDGFGDFAADSAPGLLELLRRNGIFTGKVVDLGCGSGIWAAELIRAGYDVLGVDISAGMLALARKRAPNARFRRESFLTTKLPRCDAVTSLGEIFNYAFDRQVGQDAIVEFSRRVFDALRSGGLFIFDFREPIKEPNSVAKGNHRVGKDWAVLVRVEVDSGGTNLTRWITSFRKVGRHYRRSEEVHRLHLYSATELATQLRRIGFRVRIVRGYGQRRFIKGHAGIVARKP
jgi:SAM-dependent methyltransferase